MTRQSLEQVLTELHTQLESVDDLAPEEAEKLRLAVSDIRRALDRSGEESEYEGLITRQWDEATRSFSESHPLLASHLGRIADLLSQIGI
jgi:hypothetical protein